MKKALILTWNGFQDQELVYPYYRLLGANYEVTTVADEIDKKGRIYGIMGVSMPCNLVYKDFYSNINEFLTNYDLLVLPGGVKALEKLRQEKKVLEFIKKWYDNKKVISSTCHGAQLLISAGVAKGNKIAAYYSLEDDVNNAGATYSKEPVVVSNNIVSSPHYDFMGEWMETTISQVRK